MTEKCFEERFRDVEENYKVITNRIAEAAVRSGRKPEDITFLAATKTVPAEVINHAIGCGLRIIDKVDCIQSVDSVKLAKEISRLAEKIGRKMPVLIEVNIGGEESKGGIEKAALPALLEEIAVLPGIQVNGLMAIPPICAEKSALCNYFSQMHQSFIDIRAKKIDNVFMNCLSMGMSSDYAEAIECGATMVRIGSSLFGPRDYTR